MWGAGWIYLWPVTLQEARQAGKAYPRMFRFVFLGKDAERLEPDWFFR